MAIDSAPLPAGDFSNWLREIRHALRTDAAMDVACGSCAGCCTSSYFITIRAHETEVLRRVDKALLVPAPNQSGAMLMGYDTRGHCPQLVDRKCKIYEHRPETCRSYDCRVFSAAGIAAGGDDKAEINQRVARWQFAYPTQKDRIEHEAVLAASKFIRDNGDRFPGRPIAKYPSQLAVFAVKAYELFIDRDSSALTSDACDELVRLVVEAVKRFDAAPMKPAST
jgi:Fe-S-cluster containining protein